MKELLEAGVHFGHQTRRWNPKMKTFIFGKRNGIHIVDLQKTLHYFDEAAEFIRDLAANGHNVLFVGTKRQAQDAIREEAERCGMFYMNHRWLGGTMTNFRTIRKSIQRFKEIEEILSNEDSHLTKKERIHLERQRRKMDRAFGGIKDMEDLPDALFVIDTADPTRMEDGEKTPITFINEVTHWWDGSQIYGSDQETQNRLRSGLFRDLRTSVLVGLPSQLR